MTASPPSPPPPPDRPPDPGPEDPAFLADVLRHLDRALELLPRSPAGLPPVAAAAALGDLGG